MDSFEKIHQFDSSMQGSVICIYGDSGKGKSYLAHKLNTNNTIVLDGDSVRYYINNDLGFSDADRTENNLRIARIAHLLVIQGFNVIISTVRADIAYEYLKSKIKNIRLCYIS